MTLLYGTLAGILLTGSEGEPANPNRTYVLREKVEVAQQTHHRVHLVVRGKIQAGKTEETLSGQALLAYPERTLAVGEDGYASRVARFYEDARAMFVVGTGKDGRQLRPNIRLMIGESAEQQLTLWSPSGPLTADELELIEDMLDTTRLPGLLPVEPVKVGATWEPEPGVLQALCDLEHYIESKVTCKLSKADEQSATIDVHGTVKGLALGTEVTSEIKAVLAYDLQAELITQIRWTQTDLRFAGPISPAGAFEATIAIDRKPADAKQLSDQVLSAVTTTPQQGSKLLVYEDVNRRYRFFHDRTWHVTTTGPDLVVMRKLTDTELVAQLNVNVLHDRRAGTKMTSEELQSLVSAASGLEIDEVLHADQLPTDGSYHLQLLVARGVEADLALTHRHYLATGTDGRQVVFTFIVEPENVERLATDDLVLVSTVEFPATAAASAPAPERK